MKHERDALIFSCTGRQVYANNLIVGIPAVEVQRPEVDDWIYHGYDGTIGRRSELSQEDWEDDDDHLSAAEQVELAEHMIERWNAVRKAAES